MDEAKDVVQKVVNEFVESGITIDELESAKSFLLGSEPLRNETLQQRIGRAFGEYYSDGKLGAKQVELENIASLDLDKINNFIKQHSEIAKLSFSVVTAS
jgi:predicted Zn-dependent peptidase